MSVTPSLWNNSRGTTLMDQGAVSQEEGKDTLNTRISSTGAHPKPGCNPLPRPSLRPSGGLTQMSPSARPHPPPDASPDLRLSLHLAASLVCTSLFPHLRFDPSPLRPFPWEHPTVSLVCRCPVSLQDALSGAAGPAGMNHTIAETCAPKNFDRSPPSPLALTSDLFFSPQTRHPLSLVLTADDLISDLF